MKNLKYVLSVAVAAILLSSCTITTPYAVTDAPVGSKKGSSSTTVIFGTIQTNKNFGIAEAAKKGKITGGVATVDQKLSLVFPLFFYKKELIVTGE